MNKQLVRALLFALTGAVAENQPSTGVAGDGMRASQTAALTSAPTSGTPIELALETAIRVDGGLPTPSAQHEIRNSDGSVLTVPDFAYPQSKVAVFCDGFAFHGNVDTLASDARKRNRLQAMGWIVLTFWGRQILRDPARCVEEIKAVLQQRPGG